MHEVTSPSLTRRALTRHSLLSGAVTLLSGVPAEGSRGKDTQEVWNVRDCGAKGDGKSDDTSALQRALDSASDKGGVVFVPAGEYLTRELHVRPSTAIIAVPAWNYSGPGGSVLRLASPGSRCLLNLTIARGSTIDGLSLDGRSIGQGVHGIFIDRAAFGEHEDALRIERCQVNGFSGDGLHLDRVWVYSIRHCMVAYNRGDGLHVRGWDGFVLDNWLSGNGRAGFAARYENEGASVTFTADRVEWNTEENMVVLGSDGYQITGISLIVRVPVISHSEKDPSTQSGTRQSLGTPLSAAGKLPARTATIPHTYCLMVRGESHALATALLWAEMMATKVSSAPPMGSSTRSLRTVSSPIMSCTTVLCVSCCLSLAPMVKA